MKHSKENPKVNMMRVRTDNIMYARLVQLSNKHNVTMSEIIRIAVTDLYLKECLTNTNDNTNTNGKEV